MQPREEALEEVRRRARILDALGLPVVATDMEGVILYWNKAAEATYGHSPEEAVGAQIYYILPAALPDDEIDRMMEGFAQGKRWTGELVLRRKDGEWVSTFHTDTPLRDETGRVVGVVSVSQDLGERRAVEASRREQLVTRQLVRAMIQSLGMDAPRGGFRMRELGRDLARRANCPELSVFLAAFAQMGLGDLRLQSAEGARRTFVGDGLLEHRPVATQPTCQLPLGFLEGAMEVLAGEDALGAEVRCQSMGHPECVFVVQTRARKA